MACDMTKDLILCITALLASVVGAQDAPRCKAVEELGAKELPAGYHLVATVLDGPRGLASDGRGPYGDRNDTGGIFAAWALNIFAWAGSDGLTNRPRANYKGPPPSRALRFDLTRPVPSSGARPLPVVLDSVGRVHAFFKHIADVRTVLPIVMVPEGDTVTIDRVEMLVRADGHQYVLQFGPWTMGHFSNRGAGMHGEGTTSARVERPLYGRWIVRSRPYSIGRLWLFDNPQKPEDRGLYYFDFAIQFDCRTPN